MMMTEGRRLEKRDETDEQNRKPKRHNLAMRRL
jgi:hypothetical protein